LSSTFVEHCNNNQLTGLPLGVICLVTYQLSSSQCTVFVFIVFCLVLVVSTFSTSCQWSVRDPSFFNCTSRLVVHPIKSSPVDK